jgi:phage terminase large subunit
MFDCTVVFHANRNSKAKIKINQGGTSSSKTYSIMQLLFLKAIEDKGCVITVTGESIPNLKKGAYRDAQTIHSRSPLLNNYIRSWNKADRIIYFKNGSIMEFITNLDEQSAKNGKRDYLFVNEANGVPWPIFFQLAIRTKKDIYIDYNPSSPYWSHEKLIGTTPETNDLSATVELIISDHRHNCFLSQEDHQKIEGIKDKDLWRVYARGLTGNLTGLIFPNAKRIPDEEFPKDADFIGGLDFGYTNDPTAGVKIARIANNLFLHQLCYKEGLAPIQIKQLFAVNGFTTNHPVYCEHDPDMIGKLRRLEMMALQARKGTGSVNAGLLYLKGFNIFYTASSTDLDQEKQKYMWMTDPVTGKPTNTPIDVFNHLWDATRYGAFTHWYRREE